MDMSLFSRDLIAQSTALSLSHNVFDATLLLGICDKNRPGATDGRAVLRAPTDCVCTSGSDGNRHQQRRKSTCAKIRSGRSRQRRSAGYGVSRLPLCGYVRLRHSQHQPVGVRSHGLDAARFGIHSSHTQLRKALTDHAALKIASMTAGSAHFRPLAEVVTERAWSTASSLYLHLAAAPITPFI